MSESRERVEARNEARQLKAQGWTIRQIFAHMGGTDGCIVSLATLGRWVKGVAKGSMPEPEELPPHTPEAESPQDVAPSDDAGDSPSSEAVQTHGKAVQTHDKVRESKAPMTVAEVTENEVWRRLSRKLGRDPTLSDLEHLPKRMWRLMVRLIGSIEARVDQGTLREQLGGVKILSEALAKLKDAGMIQLGAGDPRPAAPALQVVVAGDGPVQVNYDAMPTDQLRAELTARREEAARRLGIPVAQIPAAGETH